MKNNLKINDKEIKGVMQLEGHIAIMQYIAMFVLR